jgi:hypothetical protein
MPKMLKYYATGLVLLLMVAGCGGGTGSYVAVSPERYQPIHAQMDAAQAVQFPGQGGFEIHDKNSQQDPGQNGTATSAADAKPEGTASCDAMAAKGGSSSSVFSLGAALRNTSEAPLCVAVTCDIEYEYALQTTAGSGGSATNGKIAFAIEAREQGTGKLLFQHPLASLSGYEDNVKRSDQQRLQFAATISPAANWQIVLQGRTDAQSSADGQAQAQLRVTRCQMTIKPLPAPASQASQSQPAK